MVFICHDLSHCSKKYPKFEEFYVQCSYCEVFLENHLTCLKQPTFQEIISLVI